MSIVVALALASHVGSSSAAPNEERSQFVAEAPAMTERQTAQLKSECSEKSFAVRFAEAQVRASRVPYPSYDAQRRAFYRAMTLCNDEAIGEGEYLARGPKLGGLAADTVYRFDAGPTVTIDADGNQSTTTNPVRNVTQSATCSASAPSPGVAYFSNMYHMSPRGYISCSESLPLWGQHDAQKMFNNTTTQNVWNWYFDMTQSLTGTVLDHWGGTHDCAQNGTTSVRSLGVNMKRKIGGTWSAGTNLTSFWRGEASCHF